MELNNFIGSNISGKQHLLMTPLTKFYSTSNIEKIIPYLTGKSNVSLRVIDWFATNYSKKNNIVYYIDKRQTSPKNRTLKKKKNYHILKNHLDYIVINLMYI